jgi:hypothetical protein
MPHSFDNSPVAAITLAQKSTRLLSAKRDRMPRELFWSPLLAYVSERRRGGDALLPITGSAITCACIHFLAARFIVADEPLMAL